MSPRRDTIRFKIANVSLDLPVENDSKTTENLAKAVETRFREIEAESERIDTQAFALKTAYSFAAELHALRQDQDQDNKELVKTLDTLLTSLRNLTDSLANSKA